MKHKSMKRKSFGLAAIVAAGFLLGTAGQSRAAVILTSESQLSAGNQVLSAPGPEGTQFPNPLEIPYNGGTASFNGPGGFIERDTQGENSFFANFATGDPLFSTKSPGALELLFSSDVTEVGTQFSNGFSGSFTASIAAFDAGNNLIGSYTVNGNSGFNPGDNSAVFLGLRNTTGDAAIRRVLFNTTESSGTNPFGFTINQVSFGNNPTTAPVPEPSTYAMFGLGLVAIVALQRRKRKDNPNSAPVFNGTAF